MMAKEEKRKWKGKKKVKKEKLSGTSVNPA